MITLIRNVTESEVVSAVNELCFKRSTNYIGLNMKIIKHIISNIANHFVEEITSLLDRKMTTISMFIDLKKHLIQQIIIF